MKKLFLTCWPGGRLRPVETLGTSEYITGGIYIRYLDSGRSDTTTDDFLYDIPEELFKSIRGTVIDEVQENINTMQEVCGEGSLRKENIKKLIDLMKE